MKTSSRLAAAATLMWVVVLSAPLVAHATASPKIASVVDATSNAIASGGTAKGTVRVSLSATDSFSMGTADLQLRYGSGSWYCVKHWTVNDTSFSATYDWDTSTWPAAAAQSGLCSGRSQSAPTRNSYITASSGSTSYYQLRLSVTDADPTNCGAGTCTYHSTAYKLNVSNPAAAPVWDGSPGLAGVEEDGTPIVNVQWKASDEPDVVEYHWIRLNPDGSEFEFWVGPNGCDSPASGVYSCGDDDFASTGYSGTYTYALIAYRPAGGGTVRCEVPPYDGSTYGPACVESPLSGPRSVTLSEPSPSPTGTPSKGTGSTPTPGSTRSSGSTQVKGSHTTRSGGGGSSSDFADFYSGSYDKSIPYGSQPGFGAPSGSPSPQSTIGGLASGATGDDQAAQLRRIWRSVAGGLALLLIAAHLGRLLRRA